MLAVNKMLEIYWMEELRWSSVFFGGPKSIACWSVVILWEPRVITKVEFLKKVRLVFILI